MIGMRVLTCALAALGLVACLSSEPSSPSADSVSHFLSACGSDADCPDQLACICHVCTTRCSAVESCSDVASDAACVDGTTSGFCPASAVAADFCGVPCGAGGACPDGFECRFGQCARPVACAPGTTWDQEDGYCVTAWASIPAFSGNQVCGPDYYLIELPFGMNELRPRAPSQVSGGFLSAEPNNTEFGNLWSFSPNGESVCENLWGDVLGVWETGVRRTAGPTEADCDRPLEPPPLARYLRGCGVYSFSLEGRALSAPLP